MKFKNHFFIYMLALLAITACKKDGTPGSTAGTKPGTIPEIKTGVPPGVQIDTDVYIVGSVTATNGKSVAAYWKNGVVTPLPSSVAFDCFGVSIAVDGNDVYVCGYYKDYPHMYGTLATYWKNGTETRFENDTLYSSNPTGIAVYGGNSYVSGDFFDISGKKYAAYWQNGTLNNLTLNSSGSGVAVNEQGVYVAGHVTGVSDTACYWKNSTLTPYPKDGSTFINSTSTAIALSGTNIYTVGSTRFTDKPNAKVSYWKNSDMVVYLTDGSTSARANAIAVSGNDAYVGGYTTASDGTHSVATYWKNTETKTLTDGSSNAEILAIAVAGNTVYAVGYVTASDGVHEVATYWKNGVVQPLTGLNDAARVAVVTHPHVN